MGIGFERRTGIALALAILTALAAGLMSHNLSVALLTLVLGAAAVFVASTPKAIASPTAEVPRPSADAALRDVLDAIGEPVLVIDTLRVVLANAAARALLGEHVLDQDVRLAIRHPAATERLVTDGGNDEPVQLLGLGARDQHWEMRVRPIGGIRRLVHLADRTESRAADRIRVDFVANASHELRTPLAALLGFVETLQEDAGDDPAIRARFLGVMQGEARRMQRLVDDLMSLSRIEAEKYRLPDASVDLAMLAEEVREELAASDATRGADIVLDALPAAVTGDRAQLSQLLYNIVGNAMKYGRSGTPVTVRVAPLTAGTVELSVTDVGDGIAPEHLPRLTERFYRVDPGRSRAMGGTGLGLAIVKHIVERHRGRLDIASKPGEGTCITIVLPVALS